MGKESLSPRLAAAQIQELLVFTSKTQHREDAVGTFDTMMLSEPYTGHSVGTEAVWGRLRLEVENCKEQVASAPNDNYRRHYQSVLEKAQGVLDGGPPVLRHYCTEMAKQYKHDGKDTAAANWTALAEQVAVD
ncbi:hypothetical protein KKB83_01170 [Patescibacteria group bacterium]|nr:hypothetical protein [Patescibacteria group bacterium]